MTVPDQPDASTPPPAAPTGAEPPPYLIPVRYPAPPQPVSNLGTIFSWLLKTFLFVALAMSVGLNLLLIVAIGSANSMGDLNDGGPNSIVEKFHSGKPGATDKIAIVKVDGVIMEGALGFVHKEIEQAAADDRVKAIVVRINSPGGSITASDDLYRRLKELAEGKSEKNTHALKKPLVVSMASMAASGGYYIAMPAEKVLAEKTTITGSIGVYAAFPNLAKLSRDYGFGMTIIKEGDLKASGSMFSDMTPQERRLWQDMVDHAYDRFIEVVETGRPELKGKLRRDTKVVDMKIPGDDGKDVDYVRYRADGGIYTADDALKFGLIDQVGYLEDAILVAKAQLPGLSEYRVVSYEKQPTLSSLLLGTKAPAPASGFSPSGLASNAMPRLWYLAPQSELAGLLSSWKQD
jgi:protease-4